MVEPKWEVIKRFIRLKIIAPIFHHKYGCCNNPFKNCIKCQKED